MSTSPIHLIEVPIKGSDGLVWNRLHSEREDICDALQKAAPDSQVGLQALAARDDVRRTAHWHRELLQARLRKLDDALDRLMSGSYGNCCKCGRWIEDTKLNFDPAIAFCVECWQRQQTQHSKQEQRCSPLLTKLTYQRSQVLQLRK